MPNTVRFYLILKLKAEKSKSQGKSKNYYKVLWS